MWRGLRPLITDLPQQAEARDLAHVRALPHTPGNVASNVWNKGLYLSYYRDANYYGILKPGATAAESQQSLSDHHIEWFLLWGKDTPVPAYLADYTQTSSALDGDLRVFHRN